MHPRSLAVLAWATAAAIAVVPSAAGKLVADPAAFVSWWDTVGTAAATVGLVHLLAGAAFAYVALIATLVTLADAARAATLRRVVLRAAPTSVRRLLAVGAIAATVALPSPAMAAESTIVVTDLGAGTAPAADYVLRDLGQARPADTVSMGSTVADPVASIADRRPASAAVADAWLVESGDNLWTIAEDVMATTTDDDPDVVELTRYWAALIEANEAQLADPDLIVPGQVLTLPPITAGS
ncbi:MAG: LysM peptidoglycan-binding domain-containing protein [Actinomycetota bacterium]